MENPPPAPPPAGEQPAPPDQPSKPSYTHRRTGNVARLPKEIRDQINQMILDGVPYRQIIENLGEPGKDLDEGHLTTWRKGGFEDWLLELERKEALGATREAALDLINQKAGPAVQDAGRTIAGAQLYELLLSFDPRAFAAALHEKPELYLRLINALSRLSEGEAACAKHPSLQTQPQGSESPTDPKVIDAATLKEIARLIKLL